MKHSNVEYIYDCFIKPKHNVQGSKQQVYLSTWDLSMCSFHYIQKGLLFVKPTLMDDHQVYSITPLLEKLKDSLSLTLSHFYPLAGRLATLKTENPHLYTIYIDCVNSPGANFIYATVDLTIADILTPEDVPAVVYSFFDHDKAINHDGHAMSLLSVQVTELADGVFIGCSMNHMVADGTSFWHFFNSLSDIFEKKTQCVRLPILDRWFPEGLSPILSLPFSHHDEFLGRHESLPLREKIFRFSANSISKIKQKANLENNNAVSISSLQALSALVWRSITRARKLPSDQKTQCGLAINNRSRLVPRVPEEYFGNCMQAVMATTQAGELLEHGLGWSARLLNQAVAEHSDNTIRKSVSDWVKSPFVYKLNEVFDPCNVMFGSSPRFDMYGNVFGLGKAVAVRSGYAHKFDGEVTLYPLAEGGGGMELEVCLSPESMAELVFDEEFMGALSD